MVGCLTLLVTVAAERAHADAETHPPTATVVLNSGRTVRGQIDDRTDSETLWLRRMQPGVILRSGHDWIEISSVTLGGRTYPASAFRQIAGDHASGLSRERMHRFWLGPSETGEVVESLETFPESVPRPASHEIASLWISARLANWDRDPEADGLIVTVVPRDTSGRLIPVPGRLRLTLVGQAVHYGPHDDLRPRALWPELGCWDRTIRDSDFTSQGAEYRLEFRSRHPEFDFRIAADGLLTATLGVPGQGTFQASDAYVDLRPASRFRDALQQRTGQRFVRQERTGERAGRWQLGQ